MTPTKADFDNAVKQHWGSRTCLVAQCMIRNNLPVGTIGDEACLVEDFAERHGLDDLMARFDKHFSNPGDEHSAELSALRSELPDNEPSATIN